MFQPAPGKKRSGFEESFLLVLSWKCYVIISDNCTAEKDITAQLQKASGACGALQKRLWSQQGIQMSTKVQVYKAVVLPTLM